MEIDFEGSRLLLQTFPYGYAELKVGEVYMNYRRNTGWHLDTVKSVIPAPDLKGILIVAESGWAETVGNYRILEGI